jgi:hypothetical protein
MRYKLRKIRNKKLYKVINSDTGRVFSNGTTKDKAERQIRLLYSLKNKKRTTNKN